jgi:putative inorganic carbon (HCO3(-)) transporter
MPLRALLMLIVFVGSLPVCFVRPFYGIILWTVVAFLNPQSYLWSSASVFPWALAVAIPTLAGMVCFSRDWRGLSSPKILLLFVLWGWFLITSLLSTNTPLFLHHSADTWLHLETVCKILLMTVATVIVVDSFERLRIFVIVMACCFGCYVLKSLPFIIVTGGAFRLYGPEHSMIADNNDFALALNMTMPLFFFLAQAETNRRLKWFMGFLCLITIPAIFFTYSRGALFGLLVVGALMCLRLKARIVLIPVILLGVAIAVLFTPDAWKQRMNPDNAIDTSARERFNAWTFSWNLANEYPIAGGGFATFTPELFAKYAPNTLDIHGPHSVYFGVLAEHGFVGLFLYLGLVFASLATVLRLGSLARRYGDPLANSYANMFLFSLIGFLASGAFLGRAYFDYYFSIVACIVILQRVVRDRWADASFWEIDSELDHEEIGDIEIREAQCVRLPS